MDGHGRRTGRAGQRRNQSGWFEGRRVRGGRAGKNCDVARKACGSASRAEWRKLISHAPYRKEQGMKHIGKLGRLAVAIALLSGALLVPRGANAQHLGNDTIALFPKNVGEFAYANLKQARSQKWFPQLQEQMLPERFRQFER